MKKKHRDITVNGIQYGWMVKYIRTVVVFKDNKVIFGERTDEFPITPLVVETLIKKHTECTTK